MTAMLSWHDCMNLSTAWEPYTVITESMVRIDVHSQRRIIRKILCPKPLRLLLSFDVQSYFAAILLSFLNIFLSLRCLGCLLWRTPTLAED